MGLFSIIGARFEPRLQIQAQILPRLPKEARFGLYRAKEAQNEEILN